MRKESSGSTPQKAIRVAANIRLVSFLEDVRLCDVLRQVF